MRKRTAGIHGKGNGNGTAGSAVKLSMADRSPLDLLIGIIVKLTRLAIKRGGIEAG